MKNLILIVSLIITTSLYSQDIKVETKRGWKWPPRRNWTSDLTEAGNDYVGTYESDLDETIITIDAKNNHNKNKRTTVYIHKENNPDDWHPDLHLELRRTSGGTNRNYNISDGESYQPITDELSYFFYTNGDQDNVPIQYKIKGISVLLPVKDYTTTIMFTVFEEKW